MSVQLSPLSPRSVAVGKADDPYKKCWWVLLASFGLTGAWLCLPMMETSVGSTRVDTGKPAADAAVEQSLDAAVNPSGAPGDALDLAMDGAYRRKKSDEPVTSMLYSSPGGPPAAPTARGVGAASAAPTSTLAQSLKAVADKKDSSWGGEKARRGFSSPRLAGGALSGLGASKGGSSASSGSGMGAFGARNAQVGYSSTRGLRDDAGEGPAQSGGIAALRQAAKTVSNAASQRSGDAASSGLSKAFDGSKSQNAISAGGGGGADAGLYSNLDAAPVNLKVNDPNLTKREFKPPPTAEARDASAANNDMMRQLAMAAVSAAISGMIPGAGGQVAAAVMNAMMQQQQKADQSNTKTLDEHKDVSNKISG